LEGRVFLSATSHATVTQPPVDVGSSSHNKHELVNARAISGRSEARVTNRASGHPVGAAVAPTATRWSWLANTYWYVPTSNLSAVLFNSVTGSVQPVSDQTVFHITNYADGYFWGESVTQLGSSSASTSSMLGSVTPEGKVLLTFTTTSTNSSPSITNGYGTMVRKYGQWTMENQMFTSPNETLQIGHWAYMVQTRPGMPSWYSLPSADVSVPVFLSQ
jgi:hypothetical protein